MWIDVDIIPSINLQTYNNCMTLTDVQGDNDNKFVLVDFGSGTSNPQLKVSLAMWITCLFFFF